MASIPTNPDALLTREQTSQALKEWGFPIEYSTLATKASRGGGPRFHKFGARVLYRWGDSLAWAKGRLSEPRSSSAEADPRTPRRKARVAVEKSQHPTAL